MTIIIVCSNTYCNCSMPFDWHHFGSIAHISAQCGHVSVDDIYRSIRMCVCGFVCFYSFFFQICSSCDFHSLNLLPFYYQMLLRILAWDAIWSAMHMPTHFYLLRLKKKLRKQHSKSNQVAHLVRCEGRKANTTLYFWCWSKDVLDSLIQVWTVPYKHLIYCY